MHHLVRAAVALADAARRVVLDVVAAAQPLVEAARLPTTRARQTGETRWRASEDTARRRDRDAARATAAERRSGPALAHERGPVGEHYMTAWLITRLIALHTARHHLFDELGLVLEERQHRALDGRDLRRELEQRALLAANLILGVPGRRRRGRETRVTLFVTGCPADAVATLTPGWAKRNRKNQKQRASSSA